MSYGQHWFHMLSKSFTEELIHFTCLTSFSVPFSHYASPAGRLYGLLPFWGMLCLFYMLLAAAFLYTWFKYSSEIIRLHYYILVILGFAIVESAARYFIWLNGYVIVC
jgi:hypothetical protein